MQAMLTGDVGRTSPGIIRRYANPAADARYPLEYLYHLVGDVNGLTVLDLGCGDGKDTSMLAVKGAVVYALDVSPDLLQRSAARLTADGRRDSVQLLRGSAHAIPLSDASLDLVVGHAVLHHVDLETASREVHRVLRPGGRAIFKEPIRNSRLMRAIRPLIPYRQEDVSPYERPLLIAEIESFSSRFERLRHREFMLPFVKLASLLGASTRVQARTMEIDARLLARHRWLRSNATVMVFELRKPDSRPAS